MSSAFRYNAFISYSSEDMAFAERLQDYLYYYTVPRAVRRRFPCVPESVRPIFRDRTHLGINPLQEGLAKALEESRFLIVVCSLNALKSEWVNKGVETFLDRNPENAYHLIPILNQPERGGRKATDFLPPAIRERNILAADVQVLGEERVFNDVIAKMVGLEPDELWNRYLREMRRRRRRRRSLGGLAAACAAVAAWWCWDYYGTHISYYTDYIERNNTPEGLVPLDEKQRAARHRHYRFTTHKHRLLTVEYCNSAGVLQEHEDYWNRERPAFMSFEYNEQDGSAIHCFHRNARGKDITKRDFYANCIDFAQIRDNKALATPMITSVSQPAHLAPKASISRFSVSRSGEEGLRGIITQELYRRDTWNTPARDGQGLSGRAYTLDSHGRPIEVRYLRELGEGKVTLTETPRGIAGYRLIYNDEGLVTAISYYNRACKAILNEEDWATMNMHYDKQGNVVRRDFCGVDGQPCRHRDGYAHVSCAYDACGNMVTEAYSDIDGRPCRHRNGYARVAWTHDERGNKKVETYSGTDGQPCRHRDGHARVEREYDAKGNITLEAFFGTDGQPCLHKGDYARKVAKYDAVGNVLMQAYFGIDGQPILNREGFAREEARYNLDGKIEEVTSFGTDGKPCVNKNGFARATVAYDTRGNAKERAYFDAEGKRCLCSDKCAIVRWTYTEAGNVKQIEFLGVDEKRCLNRSGIACMKAQYDERSNIREIAFFGVDDAPCTAYRQQSEIELAIFGEKDDPELHKGGPARVEWTYDERGNELAETCYGLDGNIIESRKFNGRGDAVEDIRYAADGKTYDVRKFGDGGGLLEHAYFHADGRPRANNKEGHARTTRSFDDKGNLAEESFFGVNGKPIETKKYNERRDVVEETRYEEDGASHVTTRYNELGNIEAQASFGPDGKPCLHKTLGCARVTWAYDELGRMVEHAFYDTEGKLCPNSGGFARVTLVYDEDGLRVREAYWDSEGNPCLHPGGYAAVTSTYDEQRHLVEQVCFNAEGSPCLNKLGYARITWQYNEHGKVAEQAYFNLDGEACAMPNGVSRVVFEYDGQGGPLMVFFYGTGGNLLGTQAAPPSAGQVPAQGTGSPE